MLHQRQTNGITGINHDAAGNIDRHVREQQYAGGSKRTEQGDGDHGFLDIGLVKDPHTKGHVGNKGNKADGGFDDAVVGGSQMQLVFQVVVKGVIKAEITAIHQDIDRKEQGEGLVHKVPAVENSLQGIGIPHNIPQGQLGLDRVVRNADQAEQNTAESHGAGMNEDRSDHGPFTQHTAGQIAEGRGHRLNGGGVGQKFWLIFTFARVDHIGQKSHEAAAAEETGQRAHGQHGARLGAEGKRRLCNRIAEAGDQKGVAGGNNRSDLSPEGRKQEHEQQRGRRHQAEHIVRQIQILNQRGGYGMDEITGENIQGHREKVQRKAKFIAHNDVLTFRRSVPENGRKSHGMMPGFSETSISHRAGNCHTFSFGSAENYEKIC